jgi:hypothetical protein
LPVRAVADMLYAYEKAKAKSKALLVPYTPAVSTASQSN